MTITREIEIAIGAEGGEHLVAWGVYRLAYVFCIAYIAVVLYPASPDVKSAHAAWHIADKIQPLTIRTDGRVGKARQCVVRNHQFFGFAPCGITTARFHNLGISRIVGVGKALRQIHGLTIGRETACALVVNRVQLRGYQLRFAPFAFFVFLTEEDICVLGACYATQLVALGLIAGGGEIELVVTIARQHG